MAALMAPKNISYVNPETASVTADIIGRYQNESRGDTALDPNQSIERMQARPNIGKIIEDGQKVESIDRIKKATIRRLGTSDARDPALIKPDQNVHSRQDDVLDPNQSVEQARIMPNIAKTIETGIRQDSVNKVKGAMVRRLGRSEAQGEASVSVDQNVQQKTNENDVKPGSEFAKSIRDATQRRMERQAQEAQSKPAVSQPKLDERPRVRAHSI